MRITALMENTAGKTFCSVEHGLSLYVETDRHKILFDAGASARFIKNAEKLGVRLADADIAVLSHGHSDHSGGMTAFFRANSRARLYARVGYDHSRYNAAGLYIGVEPLLIQNPRVTVVDSDRLDIDDQLSIVAYSEEPCAWPVQTNGMMVASGGMLRPEQFTHEQYLIVNDNGKKVLFTGCSHRGILNIMRWAAAENVQTVIGGFHFKDLSEDKFAACLGEAADELKKYPVTYYTCHCTGAEQYEYMKSLMGDQLRYFAAGDVLEL